MLLGCDDQFLEIRDHPCSDHRVLVASRSAPTHGESDVVTELLSEATLTVRCWRGQEKVTREMCQRILQSPATASRDVHHAECDILVVAR